MFDYIGHNCPYCEEEFNSDSDIAVCPDCGTPHHRSCYGEHKACANEQKHAEDFDWQVTNTSKNKSVQKCSSCGREAINGSRFCSYCGASFGEKMSPPYMHAEFEARPNGEGIYPHPPDFDYYNRNSDTDDNKKPTEFNGIPVADWLKYIGRSTAYYLTFFHIQNKSGRKASFTLSAMLFPMLYFLYRKVWGFAAIAGLISLVLGAPQLIILLTENGILSGFDVTFWSSINTYATTLYFLSNFMWGTFAVYIYRTSAVKKLKRIKLKSATEQEYQSRLTRISGPSLTAAVAPFFIIFMFTSLFM